MESEVIEKRHNTADTSRETFIHLANKGRLIDEKKLIYEAIKEHGPVTSRRLSGITKRERGNVCRSLYDLLNEVNPSIKEAFTEKCPVTNHRVKYYALIGWQKPVLQQGVMELKAV